MKFYKLELINREQSYNQMFGTAPQIAGMGAMVQGKPNMLNNNANMKSKKVILWSSVKHATSTSDTIDARKQI